MRRTVSEIVEQFDGAVVCNHPWRYGDIGSDVYVRILKAVRDGKRVRIGRLSDSDCARYRRHGLILSQTNGRMLGSHAVKVIWICGEQ